MKEGEYICVFCGSRTPSQKEFADAAIELGEKMHKKGFNLVYGGGNRGLMGIVSTSAHNSGAKVLGIIPRALIDFEGSNKEIETVVVPDMHTRKRMMNDKCSAFITLPGGFGTFEELMEMTTWSLLTIHSKPIIVLNILGYYDPMKKQIENAIKFGFLNEKNGEIVIFCDTVDEALEKLQTYAPPETRINLDWEAKHDLG